MSDASAAQLAAVDAVQQVLGRGRSLGAVLEPAVAHLDARDRALASQLCYGTLRWHGRLNAVLLRLLNSPLRARDRDIESVLLLGLFALDRLATPDYAVVDTSVEATRALGKPWAARLVNAVLRRFVREAPGLLSEVDAIDHQRFAVPPWLLTSWQSEWPTAWEGLAQASNEQAPMALRVHTGATAPADYAAGLQRRGIESRPHPFAHDALVLHQACDVGELPGFAEGVVSVQDPAAQLAAGLLQLEPGQRVLDACAAPGGKTCHIGQTEPGLASLLALEIEPRRVDRLRENVMRCSVSADVREADVLQADAWWDGVPFERILLDAPCSGTGVIRRHPDIKHLRRQQDLPAFAQRQSDLLDALWPTLAQGGMLLYATCSVSRVENEAVVTEFIERRTDATEDRIADAWGVACRVGRQLLPGTEGVDGFYYARLRKTTA